MPGGAGAGLRGPHRRHRCAWLLIAAAIPVRAAQEPSLILRDAAATVPLQSETSVRIEGAVGEIAVRAGPAGEVRFASTDSKRARLALEAWSDGSSLILRAPEGAEGQARVLDVALPPDLPLTIEVADSKVGVNGLDGQVDIRGSRLDVTGVDLSGGVTVDVEKGSVRLRESSGSVTLRGHEVDAVVQRIEGGLFGTLEGGRLGVLEIHGDVDLDLTGCALDAKGVEGPVRLRASGAKVDLEGLASGARLDLQEAPLRLNVSRGDVDITTDGAVELRGNDAAVHVDGWGGALTSSASGGLLEVRTHGAKIGIQGFNGPVRVQGDDLEVHLEDVQGELVVLASSSSVAIERPGGAVTVETDYGDVTVKDAAAAVTVRSEEGEVHLAGLTGPANVTADGREVEVGWRSLGQKGDSLIRNDGGEVRVSLPGQGGCRVEATARFGRIESDLPEVTVSDDGSTAAGTWNGIDRPVVRVESNGELTLTGDTSPREPPLPLRRRLSNESSTDRPPVPTP